MVVEVREKSTGKSVYKQSQNTITNHRSLNRGIRPEKDLEGHRES